MQVCKLKNVILALFLLFIGIRAKAFEQTEVTDTTRILAIGNSFSEDAIEFYLYGLSKAAGHVVIIGNLYIGGAPLDLHWKNARENNAVYDYRKVDADGTKRKKPNTSIAIALADEKWDYVSMQQASPLSGLFETYVTPLPLLYNYIKSKANNPNVKYVFHQTWACARNSTHTGFANYGYNQLAMYNAIAGSSLKAAKLVNMDVLVPNGTAIQNARTSSLGDNLTRDGYHLDINIGRYIASCTWFEVVFEESVMNNTFLPLNVTQKQALIGRKAAHAAVKAPFKITKINK